MIKGVGGLCEPLYAPASGTMETLPNHYGFPAGVPIQRSHKEKKKRKRRATAMRRESDNQTVPHRRGVPDTGAGESLPLIAACAGDAEQGTDCTVPQGE